MANHLANLYSNHLAKYLVMPKNRAGCRLATYSNDAARLQLLEAAGWQPAAVTRLGRRYLG